MHGLLLISTKEGAYEVIIHFERQFLFLFFKTRPRTKTHSLIQKLTVRYSRSPVHSLRNTAQHEIFFNAFEKTNYF